MFAGERLANTNNLDFSLDFSLRWNDENKTLSHPSGEGGEG